MAIDITVPNLGESVTEATVASWLKQTGDPVEADEPVLELETDKATLEIPAPRSGVLSEILVEEGEDVEVGATLGRIEEGEVESRGEKAAAAAEETDEEAGEAAAADAEAKAAEAPAEREEPAPPRSRERTAAAGEPSATRQDAALGLDPTGIPRSGPDGRVTLDDLQSFFEDASREAVERSGPAVRKLIAEHGLDPADIPATGREGRITKEDVLNFLSAARESGDTPAQAEESAGDGRGVSGQAAAAAPGRRRDGAAERAEERVKMSRIRRTIAARLKEAQETAAILTTFNDVDMSAVMRLRSRLRDEFEEKHGVRLGFMSFFVKAAVQALKEFPEVNAQIDGEEIVYRYYYDIGVAVSTDAGLKVPVIRGCDRKGFAEIEEELTDLAERARDGRIKLEEMEGGTFSITNGGVFGSLLSTPLLNFPQAAILGLHRIEERAVVIEGEVEVRPMMYLALSYDHRLIDGRESVTFLKRIKGLIEDPERLMLEV